MEHSTTEPLGGALYYPYIHVRDANWLKMALLYWETIARMVPDGFETQDPEDTLPAVNEQLVESISPTPYVKSTAARFRKDFIARSHERDNAAVWHMINRVERDDLVGIHTGKIERQLVRRLIRLRLAARSDTDHLNVERTAGNAYMSCLATEVADSLHLPIVSHDPAFANTAPMLQFVTPSFPTPRTPGIPALVKLELPFPSAASVADISWRRILRFRKAESALREDFRAGIEEIARSIPSEGDPSYIHAVIQQKRRTIARLVKSHTIGMDRLRATTTSAGLTLSVPASITAGAEKLGADPLTTAILGGTATVILGIAWWAGYRREREVLQGQNPYRYLMDVHRLTGQRLFLS